MATVFGKEGNDFYSAFYEQDPTKRCVAFDAWVEAATPVIQAAVSEELRAFIELITQNRWTEDGWREGNAKLHRIQNDYPLVMDIKLRRLDSREKFRGELPVPVVQKFPPAVSQPVSPNSAPMNTRTEDSEDYDAGDDDVGGRSHNDDRSDSMNPNNDAYQAAMDNHSNQMNPNNDAYWSSRGR